MHDDSEWQLRLGMDNTNLARITMMSHEHSVGLKWEIVQQFFELAT